jgi:uncharacterized protein YutE (UPF0331/DUF86 family)
MKTIEEIKENYENEIKYLNLKVDTNDSNLDTMNEAQEREYCEIRAERIIQWENSGDYYRCKRALISNQARLDLAMTFIEDNGMELPKEYKL